MRYIESTPETLSKGLAIQPWGALEWHGSHLPLGLDGLVAEYFANELGDRLKATVFPVQWWAMTTLPHPDSLQLSTGTFRLVVDETLAAFFAAGYERIALITGHYAQGHMVELYQAALRAPGPVWVGTPLEPLGEPGLLDHAAKVEASQLLAIRPELVGDLNLEPGKSTAILGESPRDASAELGRELLSRAEGAWEEWLASEPSGLEEHYRGAVGQYEEYRARFFRESWEQAIRDWWAQREG
jgi:creatinine amidohydrolase